MWFENYYIFFKSNDKYLPDMIKYKFKRKEINYPYRMLILEKEK